MKTKINLFKSKSVSFIIIAACVAIVVLMVVALFLTIYTSFSQGISGAVNTQTRELSTQISYNYENYIGSIIKTSNTIQTNIEKYNLDDFENALDLSAFFLQIINLNSDILKISVYDQENCRILASTNQAEIGAVSKLGDITWFAEAKEEPTVHAFSVPYSEYGSEDYKLNVSKSIKVKGGSESAVLKIEVSFKQFIDLVKKSNLGEGGHITIIDQTYEIVYTSTPESPSQEEIDVIREITLGSRNVEISGYNMFINVGTISNTKWRICVFTNADKLTEVRRNFLSTTILVSSLILAIGVGLFLAVARAITNPMKQLEFTMRKVEKSDYFRMEEVDISASKEIEQLTKRFNKMMRKISELKALQNQINPHFLYNTLDSIVWLVENGKNAEASEMVVALARFFRLSISKETETVPVREEIEHARNYLLIQSIRYADSFDYEINVDENAMDIPTMKLILQPIVENCLYHGLKNNIDRGHIRISGYIEDDYLVLTVADNGYGMRQETIDNIYLSFEDRGASNSVGLKNIYHRVMIYFGGNAQMKIESELDEGTTITIKEPLCRK